MSFSIKHALLAFFLLTVSLIEGSPSLYAEGSEYLTNRISIVIDDFGNRMTGTADILSLPIPLTVAVMPFLPSSREDALLAHHYGHEVIIHMPMEPTRGKKEWLGPGALTTDLSNAEVRKRVEAAIDYIPHAVGMNNHMGSKVTADRRIMAIVMEVCKERGLFYLDSRTTNKSVVSEVAAEYKVPVLSNNIFLDDRYTIGHIEKQLGVLGMQLQDRTDMIAIGHVGPSGKNVATALREWSSEMKDRAVFVKASQLIDESARVKQFLP